jgi:hypothetical protein
LAATKSSVSGGLLAASAVRLLSGARLRICKGTKRDVAAAAAAAAEC